MSCHVLQCASDHNVKLVHISIIVLKLVYICICQHSVGSEDIAGALQVMDTTSQRMQWNNICLAATAQITYQ